MHIFTLAGSHRHDAQSTKVAGYSTAVRQQLFPQDTLFTCNLAKTPLPLRDEWFRDNQSPEYTTFATLREPLAAQIQQADAYVFITPERNGMATPALKNFLLYLNAQLTGNKPVLLISVSASRGWRYPIAELRMSGYKNTQLCYIPQHIIVDHVNEVLNDHQLDSDQKADSYIRQRLQYSLRMLRAYATALQNVRAENPIDFVKYGNGM